MLKKVNPRKRPATQADVDKAWNDGVMVCVSNSSVIFLTVLMDKFNAGEYLIDVWGCINKLSEEVKERRVSIPDLRRVLLEEYDIEC